MMPKVLRPWLWCIFWLGVFLCSYLPLLALQSICLQREISVRLVAGHVSDANERRTPAYIALGDSVLAYSLPQEADFQTTLGTQIIWMHYWMPNATWRSFMPYGGRIDANLRQTTFLLQESLFLDRERLGFIDLLHNIKRDLYLAVKENEPLRSALTGMYRQNPSEACNVRPNDEYLSEYFYEEHILTKQAKLFLHDLKANSRQVVVVVMPRANNEKERLQSIWRKQLRIELEKEGIPLVTLGHSMPEAYYCDGSHPNEIGREIRTAQMLELIAGIQTSTP